MTTMTRTSPRIWIGLLAAIAFAVMVALVGLNGTQLPAFTGTPSSVVGQPEHISNPVPAYLAEGIVYGEASPDATPGAQIMPAYMVEASYYGG